MGRLGADETQHLSLATKYENSESERQKLYDLVNNHCDQLKRFFNLVPEDENGTQVQENETENSMVLEGKNREWQVGNGTNMLGIKRGVVTKHSSGQLVKGGDNNVVTNNLSSKATDSHTDSSLWSTNEKALKSLTKLKLDIPRVNTNGTSVNSSNNKSEEAQKLSNSKAVVTGIRQKNDHKNNDHPSNSQRESMIVDHQRNSMHMQHQKRSLN